MVTVQSGLRQDIIRTGDSAENGTAKRSGTKEKTGGK